MSRKGNCWDNAPQESFFGHMKDEIDYKSCNTFEELQILVDDYIYYYNNLLYYFPYSGFIINSYVTKCGLFAYMAENIFDFRHVDVYCQYYSFKNDISYKSAKSL